MDTKEGYFNLSFLGFWIASVEQRGGGQRRSTVASLYWKCRHQENYSFAILACLPHTLA